MAPTVTLSRHIRVAFEEEFGRWVGRYPMYEEGHTIVEFGDTPEEAWDNIADRLMRTAPISVSNQIAWWDMYTACD